MSQELLHHFQSKLPSIDERLAAGKKLRDKFPCINQGHNGADHLKATVTSQEGFLFRRANPSTDCRNELLSELMQSPE